MPITFAYFTARERLEVTADDLAALTPEQRGAFDAALLAEQHRDSLTDKLTATQQETKLLAFLYDDARLALLHLQPQRSAAEIALAERRRMFLPAQERMRLARIPVAPEIIEATEAAADSLLRFEAGKTKLRELQAQLADAKAVASAEILKFQKSFVPISEDQLRRDYIASEHQKRAAGVQAPPDERVILAPIDAYMAGSKGSLGVRSARQQSRHPDGPGAGGVYPASLRGTYVKPPATKPWAVKPLRSVRS